jgi:hypothetical protein
LKNIIVAIQACLLPISVNAQTIIQCDKVGSESVTIVLNAREEFGTELHCIDGDFQLEGETCAPDGGFGLARPTGRGGLSGVVFRWQDYVDHVGPITGVNIYDTAIIFHGGFKAGSNWSDRWDFKVDRITGVGILKVENDTSQLLEEKAKYSCLKVIRKF